MVDIFDPKELRWIPPKTKRKRCPEEKPASKLPRPGRGEAFLIGPIPMGWIEKATRLSGRTWQVACALWFVAGRSKTKSATVSLTEKTRRRFHLSTCAVARGLKQLKDADLVAVEQQSGRRSLVTILPAPQTEK